MKRFLVRIMLFTAACSLHPQNNTLKPPEHKPFTARNIQAMFDAEKPVTFTIAGDILLARGPGEVMKRYGTGILFEAVKDHIRGSDIAFANLECPASVRGAPIYPHKTPEITFRADPATLASLSYAGFDIVSLSNNHTTDYGPLALLDTIHGLEALGIKAFGAGNNITDARTARTVTAGGITFAFLAYSSHIYDSKQAGPDEAGLVYPTRETVIEDIRNARERFRPDYMVLSFHWGEEYKTFPNSGQKFYAHFAIDNGADIVIGHHPHVMQGIEIYKGKPVFYSMGNFAFDQIPDATRKSFIADLIITKSAIRTVRIAPVTISTRTFGPETPDRKRAQEILGDLQAASQPFGTVLALNESGTRAEIDLTNNPAAILSRFKWMMPTGK